MQPRYPAYAAKSGAQGTVVLNIEVAADGSPGAIDYDPVQSTTRSGRLIAVATEAAGRWRFPRTKGASPWVRVPVNVQITRDADDKPENPSKKSSKID